MKADARLPSPRAGERAGVRGGFSAPSPLPSPPKGARGNVSAREARLPICVHLRSSAVTYAVCLGLAISRGAFGEGGVPFDETAAEAAPEGAVWDLSKPFWIFFAQQRLLAPETPSGEAIPRAAFAHVRPAGENARLFFILAGIGYLALYHTELDSLELESSVFTMLVPLGSAVYRDGREVEAEEIRSSWTDASLRARKTWGAGSPVRARLGGEYQLALRDYVEGEETAATFVLPDETAVHSFHLDVALDSRARGVTGDFLRGIELEIGAAHEIRSDWNAWGAGGIEFGDPDAERATTVYASLEIHTPLHTDGRFVLHGKLRGAKGYDLDRLTYIRLGGGGFGRQFDRVGAGSTGAANDGELFRSDGVPGYFGGEYLTDEYVQANIELDVPRGFDSAGTGGARAHVSAAYARFRDVRDGGRWKELLGFGISYTRVFKTTSALRIDLGYSPRPDRAFADSGDVTFTYIRKF